MSIISNLIASPIKEAVLHRLYSWNDDFTIRQGTRALFTDADWEDDKYKNSVILNNISTLINGYIKEHESEDDFKSQFHNFIYGLIDEIELLY